MYPVFSLASSGSQFLVLSSFWGSGGNVLVFEVNEKDPEHQELITYLSQRVNLASFTNSDGSLSSKRIAKEASLLVDEWQNESRSGCPVRFMSVSVNSNEIEVCHAGTFRAHFLQTGELAEVTRDHNFLSDPPPEADALNGRKDPIMAWWVSRCLGSGSRAEEITKWHVTPGCSVVLLSEQLHRFRGAADYTDLLTSHSILENAVKRAPGFGLTITFG